MHLSSWFALAAVCAGSSTAFAGTIQPSLSEQMARAGAEDPISVIVILADQAPIAQLSSDLHDRKAQRRERHQLVLEALQAKRSTQGPLQAALDEELRVGGVLGYTSYWIVNSMVVLATRDAIERIASRADVEVVERNFEVELIRPVDSDNGSIDELNPGGPRSGLTPGVRAINADRVWHELGLTGAGRLIGGLDTGVDGNHPALNTRWRGFGGAVPWQQCWLDVLGTNTQFPNDGNSHGTHTMGTMTGLGVATQDSIGVAYGAKWIACNAINQNVGSGFDSDVIAAFQWFSDPDGNVNTTEDVPDVVQNSWGINEGFGGNYVDCDSRWWAAIDNCEAAGVVVTWSAGNEGPGATSLRSPADRATTLTNAFSVGAVDATNDITFPYTIASFSSRGPTGCSVPAIQKLKPEVCAPGVDVLSSLPGSGYGFLSGTSMAGPHVAGVVALMREADPNLDVESIKTILMSTSRDQGTTGEDNTYGWGVIDAYAAVVEATVGFGSIAGQVTNGSFGNAPIAGATVTLLESGRTFDTDGTGHYGGGVAAGGYTARATATGFAPAEASITINPGSETTQDFSLTDNAGPTITNVSNPLTTNDALGPYVITANISDFSTVSVAKLFYRLNQGAFFELPMVLNVGTYQASIPGAPSGTQIDFYIWAQDGVGLISTSPINAPLGTHTFYITTIAYTYQAEDPNDTNWQLGAGGDGATTGIWVRADPIGTSDSGIQIQMEDDHTANPGVKCFVTGNGAVGGGAGDNDVDGGCTTLLSPTFDLSAEELAFVSFWRWYAMGGASSDDTFAIDITSNGGTSWVALERESDVENFWKKSSYKLNDFITLTNQVRFRWIACDINTPGLTEAGVDDFQLETFAVTVDVAESGPAPVRLAQNSPNPVVAATTIRFVLSNPADATLELFDASGRRVRQLVAGPLQSGAHEIAWDGRDDLGHDLGAGVYFYRLRAGAFEQSRRLTIVK